MRFSPKFITRSRGNRPLGDDSSATTHVVCYPDCLLSRPLTCPPYISEARSRCSKRQRSPPSTATGPLTWLSARRRATALYSERPFSKDDRSEGRGAMSEG